MRNRISMNCREVRFAASSAQFGPSGPAKFPKSPFRGSIGPHQNVVIGGVKEEAMNRSAWSGFVLVLLVSGAWGQESGLGKASCAGLAKLTLPNTKVLLAEQVEAGAFPPPHTFPGTPPTQSHPPPTA